MYKLLTKILADRLSKDFEELISPNQTAFIRGRNISDNRKWYMIFIEKGHQKDAALA